MKCKQVRIINIDRSEVLCNGEMVEKGYFGKDLGKDMCEIGKTLYQCPNCKNIIIE